MSFFRGKDRPHAAEAKLRLAGDGHRPAGHILRMVENASRIPAETGREMAEASAAEAELPAPQSTSPQPHVNLELPEAQTPRLADFKAFVRINDQLVEQLGGLAEKIAASRRILGSVSPFIEKMEIEMRRFDGTETNLREVSNEFARLERNLERTQQELQIKTGEASALEARNTDLRAEMDRRRQMTLDVNSHNQKLRSEVSKLSNEVAFLRDKSSLLSSQLENANIEKDNLEQARTEISTKHAKLQQLESHTRNKALEVSMQNEKLIGQLTGLVAEQENIHAQIDLLNREKGELQNRLLSASDSVLLLESEVKTLKSQGAADLYAVRNELELAQSALRTAQHTNSELELRMNEARVRMEAAEANRKLAQAEAAASERELAETRSSVTAFESRMSELNVKYMADLLSLDQQREQIKLLRDQVEAVKAENHRLAKFEPLYRAAETQIAALRTRMDFFVREALETERDELAQANETALAPAHSVRMAAAQAVSDDADEPSGSAAQPEEIVIPADKLFDQTLLAEIRAAEARLELDAANDEDDKPATSRKATA